MLSKNEAIEAMDRFSESRTPFLFFTDFLGTKIWLKSLTALKKSDVDFEINPNPSGKTSMNFTFIKSLVLFPEFKKAFDQVVHEIKIGNSFLVNLTFKTPIETNLSLSDIFRISRAKYKLRFRNKFVVFSPETFIKVNDGYIYSYPMKGTIDASIDSAEETILNDPKETAEHVTIVDLIRNDLSQVAQQVDVTKFRFISEVETHEKTLLQVSSEIRGKLRNNYKKKLGSLIFQLLPAGSISGAPKPRTVEIIRSAETYERGFYTGIFGVFDGESLDSGVMIRYIEKENGKLYYKSGGGITSFSEPAREYQEIIDKIYIPI